MTTVAVLAEPPVEGFALADLPAETPLSAAEAAELSAAMTRDVCRAVEASGGDLLVNYRDADDLPDGVDLDTSAEAAVREVVEPVLDEPDDARFEVQVGSTQSARVGNTITHLLEREEVDTAAVVDPAAPFLTRSVIDSAAMKLRRAGVVVGPAEDGRVYYAGFDEPIDFEGALEPPTIETLADRAADAGLETDFLPMLPVVETGSDLLTAVTQIAARETAGRIRPDHTAAFVDEVGLAVASGEDGLELVRESSEGTE